LSVQTSRWRTVTRVAREVIDDRLLVACGLVSLIVLAPAAGWGIPYATSEVTVRGWEVDAVTGIGVLSELSNLLSTGRADWYVAYPLFHYLVLAVAYVPYLALATMTGRLSAPGPEFPYGFADPVSAFVALNAIGHAVTVLMGCVTVMAVFVLGRRLLGVKGALIAATIALCSAPFMFYARTGNLDVPALCWTILAFVALERCWTDGLTPARAIACGSFAALAVATKDQSFGLLALPLVLLLIRAVRIPSSSTMARMRLPFVLVVAGTVTFLVAGGVIFRPDRFVRHLDYVIHFRETFTNVRYQTELTVMRPATLSGRLLLSGDLLRACAAAVGWPVVVTGLAGLAVLWRTVPSVRWMSAALVGYFLLVLVPIEHMQYRYALAPAILLAISAAGIAVRFAMRPLVFGLVTVALLMPSLTGAAEITHAMFTDARGPASAWLSQNSMAGDTLGFFGRPHQLPRIPANVHAVAFQEGDVAAQLAVARPRWVIVAPDYFAEPTRERSIFLPSEVYQALRDGSLGWTLAARFESEGLLRRPLPYLPYVNPMVQIYERRPSR